MKRTLIGVVSSNKMQKTVVVKVKRMIEHPRFKKIVKRFSKFYAHSEIPLKVGDTVEIEETRPLSKLKRWRVRRVVKRFEEEAMEVEDDKTL